MKALYVLPEKNPIVIDIGTTLEEKQRLVYGPIDAIDPFDDPVVIFLNDEGKLMNLPPNRQVTSHILIHGPFLICGQTPDGTTVELSEECICKYQLLFALPSGMIS